jgi:hypothetical protein
MSLDYCAQLGERLIAAPMTRLPPEDPMTRSRA